MVDKLVEYSHVTLPFKHWCHMASDVDFEELHAFAAQLGIPRHRFQGDHYDLPPHLRELAVEFGAEEVVAAGLHLAHGRPARRPRQGAAAALSSSSNEASSASPSASASGSVSASA